MEQVAKKRAQPTELDVKGIMERIPHRYPMLLIDRVTDLVAGESATGLKNVTANEPFFPGHFPAHPIMPGVLIVEAMAQTAATVVVDSISSTDIRTDLVYFMMIEKARFRHPVVPGDTLQLQVKKERQRGNVWRFKGEAYVKERLCAEAVFTAMLVRGEDVNDMSKIGAA